MHLEIPHTLGQEEAIRRLDQTINELQTQPLPAGVTLSEFSKVWTDNVLRLSFRASKSIMGANIGATLTVLPAVVNMDLELPAILKAFMPEKDVEDGLKGKIGRLLG